MQNVGCIGIKGEIERAKLMFQLNGCINWFPRNLWIGKFTAPFAFSMQDLNLRKPDVLCIIRDLQKGLTQLLYLLTFMLTSSLDRRRVLQVVYATPQLFSST